MKKFLLNLLLSKKQREIIWQAIIFSEYTYRRRGNIDAAAVVQTVINETQSTFNVVKDNYTKEEVDYIISQVIKDTKAESEKNIKDAYQKGVESCRQELENAYQKGVDDTMSKFTAVGVIVSKINAPEDEVENKNEENQVSSESSKEGQDSIEDNISGEENQTQEEE